MAVFFNWLNSNWFDLLQSIGICSSLVVTALSLGRDAQARRGENFLALTREHRELWVEVYRQSDLHRILDPMADLVAKPVTIPEDRIVNLILIHLNTYWELGNQGAVRMPDGVAADVRAFLELPVPREVWARSKRYRDQEFVAFVEGMRRNFGTSGP